MVAQDGTWLIKKREGDSSTQSLTPKTPSDAVKKPGPDGTSVNALEVRVGADKVEFVVNGTVVHTMPKAGMKTDGIYGIRVNHLLEVHIDGFGVSKEAGHRHPPAAIVASVSRARRSLTSGVTR